MNKLSFLPLLFALGCGTTATSASTVESPSTEKTVSPSCAVSYNNLLETASRCRFHNGCNTASVSCVDVSMIHHWKKELATSLHPSCSSAIAPNEDKTT